LIVTGPLAAVSVTGNEEPAAWLAGPEPGLDAVLADGALAEPQPANAAAARAAIAAAAQILGINGFLPKGGKEGETVGGRRARPPGRIALPTRADFVERDRRRPGLGPGGPSQLRDSAGMVR
jgi:hypothetical protein